MKLEAVFYRNIAEDLKTNFYNSEFSKIRLNRGIYGTDPIKIMKTFFFLLSSNHSGTERK